MIQNIKVTVAVPIYGVETYMERCAISLFEQSYDNIEYVFDEQLECDVKKMLEEVK